MRLTDEQIGTIDAEGRVHYPSLTVNGQPFNRGGGFSTCRLDDTHFYVYVGNMPDDIQWKTSKPKVETVKETKKREQVKREDSTESIDD